MDTPQISSKEAGTSQQHISNNITTMNVQAKIACVGCNIHSDHLARRREIPEDADMEHSTATEYVPQLGVQAPIIEAGASNNAVSLYCEQINVRNSTVYTGSRYEDQGNRSLQPSSSLDIDTLECTGLKEYYKTSLCKASPLPWYPEYEWDIDEVYTELALQDSATSKFCVEELFKHAHEHFRNGGSYRILIEGDAGYGKSTLTLKIASDWSKRDSNDHAKYTSPFSLLFVVKLGYVGEDENLLTYMESVYDEKMETPLKDTLKSKGAEEVLVLLDGYDEANASTKKAVGRIMMKETMSKCHVVLTSRFGHVPDDVKGKALLVTVKGFGRRQVTEAVRKFFIKTGLVTKDDVTRCIDQLIHQAMNGLSLGASDSDHKLDDSTLPSSDDLKNVQENIPFLPEEERLNPEQFKRFMRKVLDESPYQELAQCPLLCVMLCCLVNECPNGELPSTCSGLYFAMINRNLCRAAVKKARAAGEDVDEWNWSVLDSRFREGHESYLQEFGRLCIDGLRTKRMSFTLFEVLGKEEAAKATDVKVTQLIEAGVLVKDFTELHTSRRSHHQPRINKKTSRYQVPHRTTAEFLAAYYLSMQTDKDVAMTCLLVLFRLRTSFDDVANFLLEMGKQSCLTEAFRVIKFPSNCLGDFLISYFNQHCATGTWSEFEPALPNKLLMSYSKHLPGSKQFARPASDDVAYVTVSSTEPCRTLLQLVEEFDTVKTGNKNTFRSSIKDCPVSLSVLKVGRLGALPFPLLLQTVLKSGVVLNSLDYTQYNYIEYDETGDQIYQESARSLQALLKADSCPVHLSFKDAPTNKLLLVVTDAMQEVPEACRLKSFAFLGNRGDTTQLSEVLAEKWLSHLQHLGMTLENWGSGETLNPILKRLTKPLCSLTSLHLCHYNQDEDNKGGPLLQDLIMLATKLEALKLEGMDLHFDVTSKYVVKEKCSLKSLHLVKVSLTLIGLLPSANELLPVWGKLALNLEELIVNDCTFPTELFGWLDLSIPNLRTITVGEIYRIMPNNDKELYANQLLEALTRSSGDSIEDLSLLENFWGSRGKLMLHPIREALQRCSRMKRVNLGIDGEMFFSLESIGPEPSTPLTSSDVEALKSNYSLLALFKIVLSVPKLQSLTSRGFFSYNEQLGTYHAIADKAKKWSGKRNDHEFNASLTLHELSNEQACGAIQVFRERGLKYCLRYVTNEVYELWFPDEI